MHIMVLTNAQRQERWRNRLRTAAQPGLDQLAEIQAARDLAEQRRIELEKLDTDNAKLFRENAKLKHDIAEVRRVRDELRADVYRLRKEVDRWRLDLGELLLDRTASPKEFARWIRAAVHPDRVTDPEAKAYLHGVFTEFDRRLKRL